MPNFEFTESDIRQRFEDFYEVACTFCDSFNRGQALHAAVDPTMLYLCVVSTYDDIARYKAYHLEKPATQKANAVKRAAYAVKWIVHFSPIMFPQLAHTADDPPNSDEEAHLANVMFALHVALVNLRDQAGTSFNLRREIRYELMYDLLYRNISADALILFFSAVAELARTQDIHAILE